MVGPWPRRPRLVAGNWKMSRNNDEASHLVRALLKELLPAPGCDVVLCPPFTALSEVSYLLAGTPLRLGAQDVFWEREGAWTGEVSAAMLVSAGCTHVLVGHSERRQHFGESDDHVARKVRAAIDAGLTAIACVGETQGEREAGRTLDIVTGQLNGSLPPSASAEDIILAYEPVWAIGTGKTASPQQAEEVHAHIRGRVAGRDAKIAALVRIQYGGSVKAANAAELFSMPNVDGGLIGGASLKADEFLAIVAAARA